MISQENLNKVFLLRKDFKILSSKVNSKSLIYFDNAATTQKPKQVIRSVSKYYESYNSNVHRGIHYLSEKSTDFYENSRKKIAKYINSRPSEVIFTRGTTHSLNMLAFGMEHLFQEGDEIVLSILEHHANFVVWQELSKRKNLKINIIPLSKKTGTLDLTVAEKLINKRTRVVSITACSNLLGIYTPFKELLYLAKKFDCITILDAAQYLPHKKIDIKKLDFDFMCFSSHKVFGPTGVGVLYGKYHLLEKLKPFEYGGSMISSVTTDSFCLGEIPFRFEAGTPNISGVIGFGIAIDYLEKLDHDLVEEYEKYLLSYLLKKLKSLSFVSILFGEGYSNLAAPIVSFSIKGLDSYDVASFLNESGIAVRSGHHCVMPLIQELNVGSVTRVSLSFYNTITEIDYLIECLNNLQKFVS